MTNELLSSYKNNGFLILRKVFTKKEMNSVIDEVNNIFKIRMEKLKINFTLDNERNISFHSLRLFFESNPEAYIGCMIQAQNLFSVWSFATDTRLKNLLYSLEMKNPVLGIKPILMMMNKKTSTAERYWKSPPHQDWRDVQGSLNSNTIWISIGKTDADVGPIEVVPGSHKFGLKETIADDWLRHIPFDGEFKESDFISVPLNQGDLVIFSNFLIHRSGHNDSERHRMSLQYRYNDMSDHMYCSHCA